MECEGIGMKIRHYNLKVNIAFISQRSVLGFSLNNKSKALNSCVSSVPKTLLSQKQIVTLIIHTVKYHSDLGLLLKTVYDESLCMNIIY